VIRDFVTVTITQDDFPDFNVPRKHLVEVATLPMCLRAWVYRRGEVEWPQLLDDVCHVVVKISTYDYRSVGVLFDDVSDNLCQSCCSVLQVLLFSLLEITTKYLDVLGACRVPTESNKRMCRVPSSARVEVLVLAAFQHPPLCLRIVW
jgi:hypothetical protein